MPAKRNGKAPNGKPKTAGKTARPHNGNGNGNGHHPSLMPALIRQPNGSALLAGGVPGNAGGTGRPRSEIRDRAARIFEEKSLKFLEEVVGGEKIQQDITDMFGNIHEVERRPTVRERTEASKLLGTVSLGEMKELTLEDARNKLGRTIATIRRDLTAEALVAAVQEGRAHLVCDTLLNNLRPIWAA